MNTVLSSQNLPLKCQFYFAKFLFSKEIPPLPECSDNKGFTVYVYNEKKL